MTANPLCCNISLGHCPTCAIFKTAVIPRHELNCAQPIHVYPIDQ